MKLLRILILSLSMSLVAACGGGGGGGDGGGTAASPPPPAPPPPPPPPPPFTLISAEQGSAETRIFSDPLATAYTDNGDGIAVWRVETRTDQLLRFAIYTAATDTWSADATVAGLPIESRVEFRLAGGPDAIGIVAAIDGSSIYGATFANGTLSTPELLDAVTQAEQDGGLGVSNLQIAASGGAFAATWLRSTTFDPVTFDRDYLVRASVLSSVGAGWLAATDLSASGPLGARPSLVGGASGFMAVWGSGPETDREAAVNYYDGSDWLATPIELGPVDRFGRIGIATNGDSYQVVWLSGTDRETVLGASFSNSFVQSANATIGAAGTPRRTPRIASNGIDYLVTWAESDVIHASIGANAGWSTPFAFAGSDSFNNESESAGVAGGYAVVWSQDSRVWATEYDGAWSTPRPISDAGQSASASQLSPLASGYAATWLQRAADDSSAPVDLAGTAFDGTSWGAPTVIDTGGNGIASVYILDPAAGDATAVWIQQLDDGSGQGIFTARNGGLWSVPDNLATTAIGSSVEPSFVVSNDAGQSLAVWRQNRGEVVTVYASVRTAAGDWTTPFVVKTGDLFSSFFPREAVATDGNGFAYAAVVNDFAAGDQGQVLVNVFDGTSWSGETPVDLGLTGTVQTANMASNGSTYVVAWAQKPTAGGPFDEQSVFGSVFDAGAWSAPVELQPADVGFAQSPSIATNGSSYAVVWDGAFSPLTLAVNIYDGTGWSGAQTLLDPLPSQGRPQVRSDGTGYLVFWLMQGDGDATRNLYAAVTSSGEFADFSAPVRLTTDGLPRVFTSAAAANDSGYAVVWSTFRSEDLPSSVYANVWDGSAWTGEELIEANDNNTGFLEVVGSETGFAVSLVQSDNPNGFRPETLAVNVYDGSAWTGAQALESSDVRVDRNRLALASNGTGFGIAWAQAETDGFRHIRFSSYGGAAWSTTQLEDQAADADDARVAANADGTYTVFWRQADPQGSPVVRLPWARSDVQ